MVRPRRACEERPRSIGPVMPPLVASERHSTIEACCMPGRPMGWCFLGPAMRPTTLIRRDPAGFPT